MSDYQGLNTAGRDKLKKLRADYERVVGESFETFFCPILYRDENVHLCRAHVINESFRKSHRAWTIQRSDVDSFFGSVFEADFLALQERGRHNPVDVLGDRRLSRQLQPSISVEDDEVEHYIPTGPVPDGHSRVTLETSEGTIEMALKIQPNELLDRAALQWDIRINKDVRLPALVSLLKAAHLTLFSLLGYSYALSAGGYFLGRTVLGDFFEAHHGTPRAMVLDAGDAHFPTFVNMVRPILDGGDHLLGTLSDGRFYFVGAQEPWAMLIIIRTNDVRHAVLVPVLESPEAPSHFLNFLQSRASELVTRLATWKGDHFAVASRTDRFQWPAANYHAENL